MFCTSLSAIAVSLFSTNNFAESQDLPTIEFFLILCHIKLYELSESVSWIPPCFLFLRKPTFYLKVLDINHTTKDKNITFSSLWNRIFKIWDMHFELMQLETQCKKNYFTFFCNMKLELRNETFIWNKKILAQNQQKIFLKYFCRYLICQQSHPNRSFFWNILWLFLTLKVATYLKRKLHFFLQHLLQVYPEWI